MCSHATASACPDTSGLQIASLASTPCPTPPSMAARAHVERSSKVDREQHEELQQCTPEQFGPSSRPRQRKAVSIFRSVRHAASTRALDPRPPSAVIPF
eukprot:11693204-Alexandrium_andersonii.AAC.1